MPVAVDNAAPSSADNAAQTAARAAVLQKPGIERGRHKHANGRVRASNGAACGYNSSDRAHSDSGAGHDIRTCGGGL